VLYFPPPPFFLERRAAQTIRHLAFSILSHDATSISQRFVLFQKMTKDPLLFERFPLPPREDSVRTPFLPGNSSTRSRQGLFLEAPPRSLFYHVKRLAASSRSLLATHHRPRSLPPAFPIQAISIACPLSPPPSRFPLLQI